MWRPSKPKYKNGWKRYGGKFLEQAVSVFATRGGVPHMNERVEGEECPASECRGPGLPRLSGQPDEACRRNNINAADVANEVEIRRSGIDDTGDMKIPVARGREHPDAIGAERDAKDYCTCPAHRTLPYVTRDEIAGLNVTLS
jgi:hypothetical protein